MRSVLVRRAAASLTRRRSSTAGVEASEELERVQVALAEALETVRYVSDSAQQAYLETEPTQRGLPETYTLRYLGFAQEQVETALKQYDILHKKIGSQEMKQAESRQERFGVAVADTLLARDRLRAQISADEKKLRHKKAEGLSREDLTFCD